jgi:transcriptional repressor NrdR
MRCPACGSQKNKVIDSRLTEAGSAIRRRRVCSDCDRRFTTKERLEEEVRLIVVKKNGDRIPYNRDKVMQGVRYACYKLPVTEAEMEELLTMVEEELFRHHDREVTAQQVGGYVGERLRRLNQVAYVRYMSVHREFGTIDEFVDEIRDVRDRTERDSPTQQALFSD